MPGVTTAYQTGIHSARPANGAGCVLYSCTTHSLVYRDDGSSWTTFLTLPGAGLSDPMTTRGDIIVRNASNVTDRLGRGSADTVLKSDGTDVAYGKVLPANLDVSADNTTANATSGHHGLLPKLSGSSSDVLKGDGTFGAGGGGSSRTYELDRYSLDGTYGDDFTAASLSGIWTRRNFTSGAETYQVGQAASVMRIAMTGRAVGDGYFQTAPGGDWTFLMSWTPRYWSTFGWSLCVVNSSGTGLGMILGDGGSGNAAGILAGITTYSTYSGSFQQTATDTANSLTSYNQQKVWYSLRKSGTNYFGSYSKDGISFAPETPAFSSGITVDRVGMMVINPQGITTTAYIDIDQFNKIA